MLDPVAAGAARLCGAETVAVYRIDGQALRPVARHGSHPAGTPLPAYEVLPISPAYVTGRAVLDRRTFHVPDFDAVREDELPATPARQRGIRTGLATPLLREGVPIGAIAAHRYREARPFSEQQIRLLETFADQAVIAIENARLFTSWSNATAT